MNQSNTSRTRRNARSYVWRNNYDSSSCENGADYYLQTILSKNRTVSKGDIYQGSGTEMEDQAVTDSSFLGNGLRLKTFVGTLSYMAPEVLVLSIRNYMASDGYGVSVDWWSYGATLYKLLIGIQPFHTGAKSLTQYQQMAIQVLHDSRVRYLRPEDIHAKVYKPAIFDWIDPSNSIYDGFLIPKESSLFLSQLMSKSASKRLDGSSLFPDSDLAVPYGSVIKSHEFFKGIDWTEVEAGVAPPPYIPLAEGIQYAQNHCIKRKSMNWMPGMRTQSTMYQLLVESGREDWITDECKNIKHSLSKGKTNGKFTKFAYNELLMELDTLSPTAVAPALSTEEENCFEHWYFVADSFSFS